MGKRKRSRSRDHSYEKILKKVRRLEEQLKTRKRSISSSSSLDQEDSAKIDIQADVHQSEIHSPLRDVEMDEPATENVQDTIETSQNNMPTNNEQIVEQEPGLDPNILSILGDDPTNQSTFGENLHKDISPRWQHILLNGLPKEAKADLMKSYLTPENCSHLKAPKLNLEIKAALTEINLKKDNFSENKQNQLSSGIAAIGKALNIALSCSKSASQDLLKCLSDAGRLLCDYHFRESQSRRYAIINTLNKKTRDTVKDTKLDQYLFGSGLAEHLKSSKAIEKSGSELKPVYATQMQPKAAAATQPQRGALNSRGASRTAASETRPYAAARKLPASAPTTRERRHDTTSRSTYHRHRGRKR